MLPLPIQTEALFDGTTGQHLGGIFPPLLAGGELTDDYAACLSTRPAEQLMYYAPICPNPAAWLALVWMAPPSDNPLAGSPAVLPYMVQALDNGWSVQVHAASKAVIDGVRAAVHPLLGGGHA